jgi:uncharacterized protein
VSRESISKGIPMKNLSVLLKVLPFLLLTPLIQAQTDYEAGVAAMQRGDYEVALRAFTQAAEDGLDLAQYNLGVMYFTGRGVEQNLKQAFRWTRRAAEQGHLQAQFNLGTLYYNGQGTRRNRKEAFQWYSIAAQQDHAQAQYNLAQMYRDGQGTRRDYVKAHFWANVSRENEFADAADLLQELHSRMKPDQRTQAEREFVEWLLAR